MSGPVSATITTSATGTTVAHDNGYVTRLREHAVLEIAGRVVVRVMPDGSVQIWTDAPVSTLAPNVR